jgi:ATP-dependent helicase/nuclease subunit A
MSSRRGSGTTPAKSSRQTLIVASAGSGKTYQLSNRFLQLLVDGVEPDRILAVTFTRKAAGEILDRILLRLATAASSEKEAGKLAAALDRPKLTLADFRERLLGTLTRLHRLRVGTLDSFFAKVADAFALEFGLPLGWRIAEPIEEKRVRDVAITKVLSGDGDRDLRTLYHSLTKGETDRSVVGLIREQTEKLHHIFRETTTAAWKWMKKSPVLAKGEFERLLGNFEAAMPPEKEKGLFKAHNNSLRALIVEDWAAFLGNGIGSKVLAGESTFSRKPISAETVALYQPLVQHACGTILNRIAAQLEATYELLEHFDGAYNATRAITRGLQFSDIPQALARALDSVQSEHFSFRLDGRLAHLMLDEFQDTSLDQWKVMRAFAKEAIANPKGTFFCVGDPKQAIYGWRGGTAGLIRSLPRDLPELSEQSLVCSYRSSPVVIDAVNQVFSNLRRHNHLEYLQSHVEAWNVPFPLHSTARESLPGYVELATGPGKGEGKVLDSFFDFAAKRIKEIIEAAPGCTVGVLVRTNDAVGNLIYRLQELGIPASEEGGSPIIDSPAVELIVSLLTLADHPGDSAAEFHVRNSPLAADVRLPADSHPALRAEFAQTLRRQLIDRGYGSLIAVWAEILAGECDRRDRQRLQQLVELAYDYDAHAELRTKAFRDLIADHKADDPSANRVRVMTVHQSKGLEFDVVILPQLDDNLLGQGDSFWTDRDSPLADVSRVCREVPRKELPGMPAEMRRMHEQYIARKVDDRLCALYVGMTRAIHALHMLVQPHDKKDHRRSHAGLLRAALLNGEAMPPLQTVFSLGDRDWYAGLPAERRKELAQLETPGEEPLPKIVLAAPTADQKRGLGKQTPSGLEGGGKIPVDKLLGLAADHDPMAMLRGSVIHKCFELVTWLDEAVPTAAELRQAMLQVQDIDDADPAEVSRWLSEFQTFLAKPNLAALLRQKDYAAAEVQGFGTKARQLLARKKLKLRARNEYPFAHRAGTELRQGRIDRLVLFSDGPDVVAAEIIDFKTDRIDNQPGRTLAERTEHYRPQMAAYKETVARLYELPPDFVAARLAFIQADEMVSV